MGSMLVIERHAGESVRIFADDDTITVKVIAVNNYGHVTIGIEAPAWMIIHRDDIIKKEQP